MRTETSVDSAGFIVSGGIVLSAQRQQKRAPDSRVLGPCWTSRICCVRLLAYKSWHLPRLLYKPRIMKRVDGIGWQLLSR